MGSEFVLRDSLLTGGTLRYVRARYRVVPAAGVTIGEWYWLPPGSLDIEDDDGYGWGDAMRATF